MMTGLLLGIATLFAGELPAEVETALEQAEASGLPEGILDDKAHEGLAKGLPPARVAAGLNGMAQELLRAQEVTHSTDAELLHAAAFALKAGAQEDNVASLSDPTALWTLSDLLNQGHEETEAMALVELASASGPGALTGLASASATLLADGTTHTQATRQLRAALNAGQPPLAAAQPWTVDQSQSNDTKNKDKNDKSKAGGNGNGNGNNGNNGNGNNGNNGNGNGNGN